MVLGEWRIFCGVLFLQNGPAMHLTFSLTWWLCRDAFAGGFVAGIVEGKPLEECIDMGHWLASLSIKELGPQYVYNILLIRTVVALDITILFHTSNKHPISLITPLQQIHSNDLHVLRLT